MVLAGDAAQQLHLCRTSLAMPQLECCDKGLFSQGWDTLRIQTVSMGGWLEDCRVQTVDLSAVVGVVLCYETKAPQQLSIAQLAIVVDEFGALRDGLCSRKFVHLYHSPYIALTLSIAQLAIVVVQLRREGLCICRTAQ